MKWHLTIAAGSVLLLLSPLTSWAQSYDQSARTSAYSSGGSLAGLARDVTLTGIDLNSAWRQLQDARAAVPALSQLRKEYHQGTEYQQAWEQQRQAQMNYTRAHDNALALLYLEPQYKQALFHREVLEARLRQLRVLGPRQQILPTAEERLQYTVAITQMEQSALDKDPRVRQASQALEQANARLRGLDDAFNRTWQNDPAYIQNSQKLAAAQEAYNQAARVYAGAAAAYDQAIAYVNFQDAQKRWVVNHSWGWGGY